MAIYHLSVGAVSRSRGQTAARAIGYALGDRLREPEGRQIPAWITDRRADEIAATGYVGWAGDAQSFASSLEHAERRKDACVARTAVVALPWEVTDRERERLVRGFACWLNDQHGCAVAWAIHRPSEKGDDRNHHAHLVWSTRASEQGTFGRKKILAMSSDIKTMKSALNAMRVEWEKRTNRTLERSGFAQKVSCKSHETNGIPLIPTQHVGARATAAQRRNKKYENGVQKRNREAVSNAESLVAIAAVTASARIARSRRRNRPTAERVGANRRDLAIASDGEQNLERGRNDTNRRSSVQSSARRSSQDDQPTSRTIPSLDEIKGSVPIDKLAGAHGWRVDLSGGRGSSIQMRHQDQSREIVVSRAGDGHWQYFRRDGTSAGSVIDFAQRELGWGDLGDVRRRLAAALTKGLPEAPREHFSSRLPKSSAAARPSVVTDLNAEVDPQKNADAARDYLRSRNLSDETIEHFAASWAQGSCGEVLFKHQAGGHGFERRGPQIKQFSPDGKKGLWVHRIGPVDRLVITESGINAMSYAQYHALPERTSYASTGGGFGPEIARIILEFAKRLGAIVVAAFDGDSAGERFTEAIKLAALEAGAENGVIRETPPENLNDWNDAVHAREEKLEQHQENEKSDEEEQKL